MVGITCTTIVLLHLRGSGYVHMNDELNGTKISHSDLKAEHSGLAAIGNSFK